MSSSIYEMYEVSDELSQGGVWIEFGGKVRVLIARADRSNKNFSKTMRAIQKRTRFGFDEIGPEEDVSLVRELLSESLVLDFEAFKNDEWVKGIPLRDGLVPFSKEALEALLKDLPDFAKDLFSEATNMSNFAMSRLESAKKN